MTKAELQKRAQRLNECVTIAIGIFEALGERINDPLIRGICSDTAGFIRAHAGSAWIDGEKQ